MRRDPRDTPEKALALPHEERAALIQSLIESSNGACKEDIEEGWKNEIRRRIADLDSGKAKTVTWEEVRQRISARPTRIPPALLRFFNKEEHARAFVAGKIRFGLLDHYRVIEGLRQDDTEGRVSFEWNQKAPQVRVSCGEIVGQGESDENIRYTGSSLNPYFILSASHPESNTQALRRRFGQYIVRINNPQAFLHRVEGCWVNHPWACSGSAWIVPVVYNKGDLLEANPYLIAPSQYSYSQKPRVFEEEREFRFVLECAVEAREMVGDYLTLDLSDCGDIAALESEAILD